MPLSETPFARALAMSRGTVSVVDKNGTAWSRIWCVYELYQSHLHAASNDNNVLRTSNDLYISSSNSALPSTLDLYTALEHTNLRGAKQLAVGLCDGLAAVDLCDGSVRDTQLLANKKAFREKFFPLKLTDIGIAFKCQEGSASRDQDKTKILTEIGDQAVLLNQRIHGVVAAAAMERVLRDNNKAQIERYLAVLAKSPPVVLRIDLRQSEGDLQENVSDVVEALVANGSCVCQRVEIRSRNAVGIPHCVSQLAKLEVLVLIGCSNVESLPNLTQMSNLRKLDITGCSKLDVTKVQVAPCVSVFTRENQRPDVVPVSSCCCCVS